MRSYNSKGKQASYSSERFDAGERGRIENEVKRQVKGVLGPPEGPVAFRRPYSIDENPFETGPESSWEGISNVIRVSSKPLR
jgi:hypothetical protein